MNTRSRPRNAAKGVKATKPRRMWALSWDDTDGIVAYESKCDAVNLAKPDGTVTPVLVLSASPSDVAALREKILAKFNSTIASDAELADIVLAALGLTERTTQGRRM